MHVQHPSPHHPLPPSRQSVTALILGQQPVYTSAVAKLFGLCACLISLLLLLLPVDDAAAPGWNLCAPYALAASESFSLSAAPPAANMLSIVRVIMDTYLHDLWHWAASTAGTYVL